MLSQLSNLSLINKEEKGVIFNFYKPEEEISDPNDSSEPNIQAHQTEDNKRIGVGVEATNYDPIVGSKEFGNTMPLPKKNNLLESNRTKTDNDLACKKFLEKIKEGDGINKKQIKQNRGVYNYVLENKKKVRKESAKRKRSAKGRESDKKLGKEMSSQKQVIHRKSYSEVVRDQHKKKIEPKPKAEKDVVINWQNVYNFNIQNSQLVNSKNASIQYFSHKNTAQKPQCITQKL